MIQTHCPQDYHQLRENLERFLASYTCRTNHDFEQSPVGTIKIIGTPKEESNCAGYCLSGDKKITSFKKAKYLLEQRVISPSEGDILFYVFQWDEAERILTKSFLEKIKFSPLDFIIDCISYIPSHLGRYIRNGRVVSRWGTKGPVINHEVWEVPLSFGEHIFFYKKPEIILY